MSPRCTRPLKHPDGGACLAARGRQRCSFSWFLCLYPLEFVAALHIQPGLCGRFSRAVRSCALANRRQPHTCSEWAVCVHALPVLVCERGPAAALGRLKRDPWANNHAVLTFPACLICWLNKTQWVSIAYVFE